MGLGQVFAKLVLRDDTNLGEQKIQYKPKLETTEVKGSFSIDSRKFESSCWCFWDSIAGLAKVICLKTQIICFSFSLCVFISPPSYSLCLEIS